MEFTELLNFVRDYGLTTVMAMLVVFLLVIPKLKSIEFIEKVNNKLYKNTVLDRRITQLPDKEYQIDRPIAEHPFFRQILDMIRRTPSVIDFGGPVRSELFSDMFVEKSNVVYSRLNSFVSLDFKEDLDWYNTLTQIMNDMCLECEFKWIKMGVPQIAIDKFNEWHGKRIELIKSEIRSIYEMKGCDLYEKTYAILDLFMFIMRMTLVDLSKAAWILNGTLTGKKYKGQIIEELKH